MDGIEKLNPIGQLVPELPVLDVERAQRHYRDALGFQIGWLYPTKDIGAVSRDKVAIFFRKRTPPFDPAVNGGEGAITVTRDPLVPPLVPNAIRSEPVRPALQNVWGRKAMATSVFGRPTVSFSHACQALGGNHHPILHFARCRGDSPRAAWRS